MKILEIISSPFNLLRTPLCRILRLPTPTLQEPSLAPTSIEMIRDIRGVLARSDHTTSHFITVGIHYSQTVSGVSYVSHVSVVVRSNPWIDHKHVWMSKIEIPQWELKDEN